MIIFRHILSLLETESLLLIFPLSQPWFLFSDTTSHSKAERESRVSIDLSTSVHIFLNLSKLLGEFGCVKNRLIQFSKLVKSNKTNSKLGKKRSKSRNKSHKRRNNSQNQRKRNEKKRNIGLYQCQKTTLTLQHSRLPIQMILTLQKSWKISGRRLTLTLFHSGGCNMILLRENVKIS